MHRGGSCERIIALNGVWRKRKLKLTSKREDRKEACLQMINFNIIATFQIVDLSPARSLFYKFVCRRAGKGSADERPLAAKR